VSPRLKRVQRPDRELEQVRETDLDGRIVLRRWTVDSLGKLLRSGAVTESMHERDGPSRETSSSPAWTRSGRGP
jgi:hypothetical protein